MNKLYFLKKIHDFFLFYFNNILSESEYVYTLNKIECNRNWIFAYGYIIGTSIFVKIKIKSALDKRISLFPPVEQSMLHNELKNINTKKFILLKNPVFFKRNKKLRISMLTKCGEKIYTLTPEKIKTSFASSDFSKNDYFVIETS
ncbi:MAG: hypothetical protein CMF49_10250 [Legionellales bacterium]|nr:hypothetical protein [Legionellales bacterium]|tara:strand:- start:7418 stop:7852 length:435 start_codon:yes stop_codon:yes gene_type:complete